MQKIKTSVSFEDVEMIIKLLSKNSVLDTDAICKNLKQDFMKLFKISNPEKLEKIRIFENQLFLVMGVMLNEFLKFGIFRNQDDFMPWAVQFE
ncbi:MAG: hypothetical protein EOM50_08635 [Erysipelotrichia bacterium]|nr:hypothetical protein [Erysipelotrichia bacterium]